jgi:hypothetical protein
MTIRHQACLAARDLEREGVWSVLDSLAMEDLYAELECPVCPGRFDEASLPVKPYAADDERLGFLVRATVEGADGRRLPAALAGDLDGSATRGHAGLPPIMDDPIVQAAIEAARRITGFEPAERADPRDPVLIIFLPGYTEVGNTRSGVLDQRVRRRLEKDAALHDLLAVFPLRFAADREVLGGKFRDLQGTLALG